MAHSVSPPAGLISRACYEFKSSPLAPVPTVPSSSLITSFVFIRCFFLVIFQLGLDRDSPQTHLSFHRQTPVLDRAWLYSDEKHCISCTPYFALFFCLIVGFVATPCFLLGSQV